MAFDAGEGKQQAKQVWVVEAANKLAIFSFGCVFTASIFLLQVHDSYSTSVFCLIKRFWKGCKRCFETLMHVYGNVRKSSREYNISCQTEQNLLKWF